MDQAPPITPYLRQNRTWTLLAVVVWTLAVAGSLIWNTERDKDNVMRLAMTEAKTNLNRDMAFRQWFTALGGAYLKVGKNNLQPSPFMSHVPEQNIVTPAGVRLTQYAPASMLRMMQEEHNRLYGVKGRITGLKYLNPNNAPDAWERQVLLGFNQGHLDDVTAIEEIGGKPFLRMMQPMYMEQKCLPCHAWTGIPVGGVRGATNVAISLSPYYTIHDAAVMNMAVTHGGVWLAGLLGIGYISRRNRQYETERQHAEGTIRRLAYYDPLTDLPNRRLLRERLEQAITWSRRAGTCTALLYVDLDRFKTVNDTLGHGTGDALLQVVSTRLVDAVRAGDTVSRLGGDEFAIVLGNLRHGEDTAMVAEKLIEAMKLPFELEERELFLTASIGISLFPDDSEDLDVLFSKADIAMYQAKDEGKNTFRFYSDEINAHSLERMELETCLRQSMEKGELFLEYQPQVDVRRGEVFGVEALVRWQCGRFGLIRPDRFIYLAEETGLIVPMGEWILRTACREFQGWRKQWTGLTSLSVNLSAVQLRQPGLLAMVERVLDETGMGRGGLILEITESALVSNPEEAITTLNALSRLGVGVSIDDFGTGYSSLSYLKRFPVSELKIDRSFVDGLADNADDVAIAQAVIALAKSLNLDVIAEGVETAEQLHVLESLGCHRVQGYYLGRPMGPDGISALLTRGIGKAA
jgi:diguanylate cyclase (GGDEF)-like protein